MYFLRTFNIILQPVHFRWSQRQVTRVSHDQPHHFSAKHADPSRMRWEVQAYFLSWGDTSNLRNREIRTRERLGMTVLKTGHKCTNPSANSPLLFIISHCSIIILYLYISFCSADRLVCVSVGSLSVTGDRIALTGLTRSAKTRKTVPHKLFVVD